MKRIFSGIKPSGNLHLGNYLGAIQNWLKLQNEYDSLFCVVDLHAITVPQKPETLKQQTLEIAKVYLAAGIDPERSTVFVQSRVKEHTELCWILNTIATIGELEKMTQFKDKAKFSTEESGSLISNLISDFFKEKIDPKLKDIGVYMKKGENEKAEEALWKLNQEKSNLISESRIALRVKEIIAERKEKAGLGLFDYPVLMAADILLYDTDLVPVGEDQFQHVELTRTLAQRFNKRFGETFNIPATHFQKEGLRIMGLDDPAKKMSKSAQSPLNYIALTDSPEDIRNKFKKAVTDSGSEVKADPDKPALTNLLNIYSLLDGKSVPEIEKDHANQGYAEFKKDLAEVVVEFLGDFQKKYDNLKDAQVQEILEAGAKKAQALAGPKMVQVRKAVGLE